MNYYLKTTDEQSMWLALESAGLAVKDYNPEDPLNIRPDEMDGEWSPTGAYDWRFTGQALDIIGTIYKPTGEMLMGEDGEYPEMAALDGFHANLKATAGLTLPTIDAPTTPYRKWAGE